MIGQQANVAVKTSIKSDARIAVRHAISAEVQARSGQQIADLLELGKDSALLQADEIDICAACGQPSPAGSVCEFCGESLQYADEFDPDDELLGNEEMSTSEADWFQQYDEFEPIMEGDSAEQIRWLLLDEDWPLADIEEDSLLLARLYQQPEPPTNAKSFRAALQALGIAPKNWLGKQPQALRVLAKLRAEAERNKANLLLRALLIIDAEGTVTVEHALKNWQLERQAGYDEDSEFRTQIMQELRFAQSEIPQLLQIGQQLFEAHQAFFTASDREQGLKALTTQVLAQNEFAGRAQVDAASLSRWCQHKDVWVASPHGHFKLADFFNRPARANAKLASAQLLELILDAQVQCQAESPNSKVSAKTIANHLKAKGFKTTDRTVNRYRNIAAILAALPRAPKAVQADHAKLKDWLAKQGINAHDKKTLTLALNLRPPEAQDVAPN